MKKVLLGITLLILITGAVSWYLINKAVDDDCKNVGGHWVTEGDQRICDVK